MKIFCNPTYIVTKYFGPFFVIKYPEYLNYYI